MWRQRLEGGIPKEEEGNPANPSYKKRKRPPSYFPIEFISFAELAMSVCLV